jgi:hypothetical protein
LKFSSFFNPRHSSPGNPKDKKLRHYFSISSYLVVMPGSQRNSWTSYLNGGTSHYNFSYKDEVPPEALSPSPAATPNQSPSPPNQPQPTAPNTPAPQPNLPNTPPPPEVMRNKKKYIGGKRKSRRHSKKRKYSRRK